MLALPHKYFLLLTEIRHFSCVHAEYCTGELICMCKTSELKNVLRRNCIEIYETEVTKKTIEQWRISRK